MIHGHKSSFVMNNWKNTYLKYKVLQLFKFLSNVDKKKHIAVKSFDRLKVYFE